MSKIRINDLARELEVKSKAILDVLLEVGVTEKKTHSSSIEEHEAEKVRAHFRAAADSQTASKSARPSRAEDDGIKTKIDLSHISKPGDVLRLISKQQAAPVAPPRRPVAPPPAAEKKPVAPVASAPATPAAPPKAAPAVPPPPQPRLIVPQPRPPVPVQPPPAPPTPPAPRSEAAVPPRASAPVAAPSDHGGEGTSSSFGCCTAARTASRYAAKAAVAAGCDHTSTAHAAHDCSADWATSGVQGAAASSATDGSERGSAASGTWTPYSRPAYFPASASRSPGGYSTTTASWRTSAHASDAAVAFRCTAFGGWSRRVASRTYSSRQPSRRACKASRPALCSSWCEGRPDEGLHSPTAGFALE